MTELPVIFFIDPKCESCGMKTEVFSGSYSQTLEVLVWQCKHCSHYNCDDKNNFDADIIISKTDTLDQVVFVMPKLERKFFNERLKNRFKNH